MERGYQQLDHQHSHKSRQYRKHHHLPTLSGSPNSTSLAREDNNSSYAMKHNRQKQHYYHTYRSGENNTNGTSNAGNYAAILSAIPVAGNDIYPAQDDDYYRYA